MPYPITRFIHTISAICCMLWCACTLAASSAETVIQKRFVEYLGVNVEKSDIVKTPYSGLYEVRVGNNLVYTDAEARYLFIGNIMDIQTRTDYTNEKLRKFAITDFSSLPKDLAIQIVKGSGEGKMAVFSDPTCRHCKQLEYNLRNVDNVTIYLYPLNILSEKSVEISRNIWCSPNPAQAWHDWMINDKMPAKAGNNCAFPDKRILALGKQLNIEGTPTIFFADGTRVPGVAEADSINLKLQSLP